MLPNTFAEFLCQNIYFTSLLKKQIQNMSQPTKFMVKFNLTENFTEAQYDLVPQQRMMVGEFFSEGKLASYTLSLEYGKLWAVINAGSVMEVVELINKLPLTQYMQYKIYPLSFHQTMENSTMTFSLN